MSLYFMRLSRTDLIIILFANWLLIHTALRSLHGFWGDPGSTIELIISIVVSLPATLLMIIYLTGVILLMAHAIVWILVFVLIFSR